MIDAGTLGLFALASAAIVVVPGPTVTIIIANSLAGGARPGLLNVLGTQIGLATMLVVLAVGFGAIVDRLGTLFELVRFVGAAYLVWLGIGLWRAGGSTFRPADATGVDPARSAASYVRQGFLVIWANPKALVFFGAFIPQFVDASRAAAPQLLLLGAVFMVVGTVFDSAYALLAGRLGRWLDRRRARSIERTSGSFMIAGGLWLAASGPPS